ncbi:protein MpIDA2 [Marchantia polymorpha subsp. ruderalis]|uniref:Uncharacterized protein n=2 Tax=Marchantia polymorpha TaxID=3197 RepID=A0AAF6BYA4_MARPO|nr:hypothetical protein MARPO_0003s0117 [Marchantia polymorpha]BBN16988.1 hypothetical protein Mp_7g11030 [Marchantia polymorpha subsp. ruderalis]|eukprot:PTQ49225.1 hypothetical protein MARPO_0003s0117 [Marchantia polymorpha]
MKLHQYIPLLYVLLAIAVYPQQSRCGRILLQIQAAPSPLANEGGDAFENVDNSLASEFYVDNDCVRSEKSSSMYSRSGWQNFERLPRGTTVPDSNPSPVHN